MVNTQSPKEGKLRTQHDEQVKLLMSDPSFAKAMAKVHLPDSLKDQINWDSLRLYPLNTEFVDKQAMADQDTKHRLKSNRADVAYLFKICLS